MGSMVMTSNEPAETKPEKQFLYRLQTVRAELLKSGPTKEESALVEEHFNYLKNLTAKGVVYSPDGPSRRMRAPSES